MKKTDQTIVRVSALKHLARGQKAEALEDLKSIIFADGHAVDAYVMGGILLREKGEFDKAIHVHRSVMEKSDLSAEAKEYVERELAADYNAAGDYKSTLVLTEGRNMNFMPHRAEALEKTMYFKIAAETYEKCARLDVRYRKNAARCWYQASFEEGADAVKLLKYAEKNDPSFFEAKFRHASIYYSEGKKIRAGWVLDNIISSELPKNAEHMTMLEELYYEYHDVDKLFNTIMQKINGGSANCAFYIYAAIYYIKKNDNEKAKHIIGLFAERYGQRTVFVSLYAEMLGDRILNDYFEERSIFKCAVCGAEHSGYFDKCPVCLSFGTLSYF